MQDMRTDAELLGAMLNESEHLFDRVAQVNVCLSAKVIAQWTNRSLQTISDYRTGKTNIPIDFWREMFARTWDMRIASLLFPDYCNIEINDRRQCSVAKPKDFFREALQAEGLYHQQQSALCEILADGKIDDLDGQRVQKYDDAYWQHRTRDSRLHRAILHSYRNYASKAGAQ